MGRARPPRLETDIRFLDRGGTGLPWIAYGLAKCGASYFVLDAISKAFYKKKHIVFNIRYRTSLIGNPVKIGSGPAAVNGDEIR